MTDTAEVSTEVLPGDNLRVLKATIAEYAPKILAIQSHIGAQRADIRKLKDDLAAKGIPRRAFNRAFQDWLQEQDDDGAAKRQAEDAAYSIAREALLLPPTAYDLNYDEETGEVDSAAPQPEPAPPVAAPSIPRAAPVPAAPPEGYSEAPDTLPPEVAS